MEILFLKNRITYPFFFIFFLTITTTSCRKSESFPDDALYQPLMLSWEENNAVHHFKVGENALFSRSFVILNHDGYRIFVYDFYKTNDSYIRISLTSEELIEDVEVDLENTLRKGREIMFNINDHETPGKVAIEFFVNQEVRRTSKIAENSQMHLKISNLKKVWISERQFFEADITFNCFVRNQSDGTISELKNGQGKIAYRYK